MMNLLLKYLVEKIILLNILDLKLIKEESFKLVEMAENHSQYKPILDIIFLLSKLELAAIFTQLVVIHNQFLKLVSKLNNSNHQHLR